MMRVLRTKTSAVMAWLSIIVAASAQESGETSHVAVDNPATLSPDEANALYDDLREQMAEAFALSELPEIEKYSFWGRYNSTPYLSATHGRRFVNNYANVNATAYGNLTEGETYPVGTVFAKDSFTVTDDKQTYPGALFVMEKLSAGSSEETADWRYLMVLPDGTSFGDTAGDRPELVEYCHACHKARAKDDFVFYVPDAYRLD